MKTENQIINDFWEAHPEAFFNQKVLTLILRKSSASFERDRWQGGGIPYFKIGRLVKYRKKDVVEWINSQGYGTSSTEIENK